MKCHLFICLKCYLLIYYGAGKEDTGKYGERVNIWTEPEGPQYCTVETGTDGKTVLLAGTLNKLVIHLTSATATGKHAHAHALSLARYCDG